MPPAKASSLGLPSPASRLSQLGTQVKGVSTHPAQSTRLHEADKRSRGLAVPRPWTLKPGVSGSAAQPGLPADGSGTLGNQPPSNTAKKRATELRAAVAQTAGPGDEGWLRYVPDNSMDLQRLTMMKAELHAAGEEKRITIRRPIISMRTEGPRATPAWGRGQAREGGRTNAGLKVPRPTPTALPWARFTQAYVQFRFNSMS